MLWVDWRRCATESCETELLVKSEFQIPTCLEFESSLGDSRTHESLLKLVVEPWRGAVTLTSVYGNDSNKIKKIVPTMFSLSFLLLGTKFSRTWTLNA